ncbi:MAG: phosphatidylglycerophosphatase A [Verrucomicrobia bacterium]|nr:phosphatidylglycerophosphatase A [Verrucomicrobiota bacterium]
MIKAQRPLWWSLIPARWVAFAATCGPIGYWGKAPGTNGSIVGLLLYTTVMHTWTPAWQLLAILVMSAAAVVFCGQAEVVLQKRDPGEVILDEVVAVPLCFVGLSSLLPADAMFWPWAIGGFLLFRYFDITKPLFVNSLQKLPHGWGIVADDLAAALCTWGVLFIFVLVVF